MLLVILAPFLVLFCMVGINYRVTRSHLTITFWGIPIRWTKLSTIVSVSKRRRFTAEKWVSTLRMQHRRLASLRCCIRKVETHFSAVKRRRLDTETIVDNFVQRMGIPQKVMVK